MSISSIYSTSSYAQYLQSKPSENKYRAVHWTIYDGLSQGENYYILKDIKGFLWTGTKNGLNRFDGSLVKNYYHEPHNPHTIISSYILGLAEDSLHNIWIGTNRGLSRLDIKADTFSNFSLANNHDPNHDAIPFCATRDKLYAQEGPSIVVYNIHSLRKKTLAMLTENDGFSFGPSPQYSFFDSKSNSIWMLRGVLNGPGGGLMKISLKDGKKQYYSWPCYRNIPNHDHSSEAMRFDSKRNAIWINSSDGLVEFTLADEQFHEVKAMADINKLKDYNRFVGIDIDREGRIWFATHPRGIFIYDPITNSLSKPFPNDTTLQKAVSYANSVIYCDREGMIWCGSWLRNGIFQLIPFSPVVKLFTPNPAEALGFGDNMAFLFHNTGAGKLWVVTAGSLYQFDKNSMTLAPVDRKAFPGYKASESIVPVLVDTILRKAWIGNAGIYFEMNLDTRRSVPVTFEDSTGKPIGPVEEEYFLPFRDGWLLTGIYQNRKYIFTSDKSRPVARAAGEVPVHAGQDYGTITDGENLLFLKRDESEGNLTYRCQNGRWLRQPHKMDSLQWTSIFFNAKDKSYWVAGENKIFHYDPIFRPIRTYGKADGLPDLVVVGLIADNNGNIWFHTDRSIHQLN
ncbi:MAG TPA: two-component regulator propeller domain-containing protein, partial [Mucilaginibacter sp.]|nr:two-component regulator propeller domain-containing protein [Mucilaginibacter sp.]